jgi:hypothetical protein
LFCCCQRIPVSQPSEEKDGKKDGSTSIPLDVSLPKFSYFCVIRKKNVSAGLSVLGFVLFPFGRFFRKIPDCCMALLYPAMMYGFLLFMFCAPCF